MPLCPLVCVGSVSLHRLLTLLHVCQFLHIATGATTGTCQPCPTGTYKKTTGPGPCSDCPAGKTSPVGSTLMSSCKFCARDYFLASQNLYTMSSQDCFPSSTAGWQGAVESGLLSGSNPECFLTRALSLLSIDLLTQMCMWPREEGLIDLERNHSVFVQIIATICTLEARQGP